MFKNNKLLYSAVFYIYIILLSTPLELLAEAPDINPWFKQAVLLKTYQQSYDWRIPWEKGDISTQTGLGLVVSLPESPKNLSYGNVKSGNLYLMTTAELVANATLIEATRKDIRVPFQGKLMSMDFAANLALIEINNAKFWSQLKPVKFFSAKSSKNDESKSIYSLIIKSPDEWDFESGSIERMTIGHREESDAWVPILKISGLSKSRHGYPIIQDNKTIAMVLDSNRSVAKAFPAGMLLEFLNRVGSEKFQGLTHRGFKWRRLPQGSIKEYLGIPENKSGIMISQILPHGTGSDVLKVGDYLTTIGMLKISHNGKINHPNWGFTLFDLLFLDQYKAGDYVNLSVIRDKKPLTLKTKVKTYGNDSNLVPMKRVGFPPRYIIQGGFLFQELTIDYLSIWGKNWRTRAPLRLRLFLEQNKTVMIPENNNSDNNYDTNKIIPKNMSRVVLVTQVIPDAINIGYQNLSNAVVLKINDHSINSLLDVSKAFLKPKNKFHLIEFLPGSERMSVVLPFEELEKSNHRIKINFRIPKLYSL
tara:strand:- start:548 stop:2146 length:1599 start_codon:yes stop_codon:yes gene_type:complete